MAVFDRIREAPLPCIVRHPVEAAFLLPASFSLGAHPGLLSCQVLSKAGHGSDEVLSQWTGRDHFDAGRAAFEAQLGLREAPQIGIQRCGHFPSRPSRLALYYGAVVTIVAALGYFRSLREYAALLVTNPKLEVDMGAGLDVAEGESVPWKVRVTNVRTSITTFVEVLPPAASSDGVRIEQNGLRFLPELGPRTTQETEFTVEGRRAGEYTVDVTVTGEAGWFRGVAPFPARTKIHVWPRLSRTGLTLLKHQEQRAEFVFTILSGVACPLGVACEAVLLGSGVELVRPKCMDLEDWTEPVRNGDTELLRWVIPPMAARTRRTCGVELRSAEPLDEQDWLALLKDGRLQVEISRRKE